MKKRKHIAILLIGVVLLYFVAMYLSTNSVTNHVRSVILGSVEPTDTDPMKSLSLKYATTWDPYHVASANITIRRIFVCHNFVDGFMVVQFDWEFFDADGNRVFTTKDGYGRGNEEKWIIHRGASGWEIVKRIITL